MKKNTTGILGDDVPDPYVRLELSGQNKQTVTIKNDLNPRWNSNPFFFEVRSEEEVLGTACYYCPISASSYLHLQLSVGALMAKARMRSFRTSKPVFANFPTRVRKLPNTCC